MNVPVTVTVTVFDQEQYDGPDWPAPEADKFIAWLSEKVRTIPQEYRSAARIEFSTAYRYEDAYARIEISYTRPETGAEEAIRLGHAQRKAENDRQEELAVLRRLQEKYGAAQ